MKLGDATIAQIVASYELAQLNEYAIVEQLDLDDVDSVRDVLITHSSLFKERYHHTDPNPLASTEQVATRTSPEYEALRRQYTILAKTAESEIVREKALRWLMDDELGRNDIGREMLAIKKAEMNKTNTQEERLAKFESLMRLGIQARAPMIQQQQQPLQLVEKVV